MRGAGGQVRSRSLSRAGNGSLTVKDAVGSFRRPLGGIPVSIFGRIFGGKKAAAPHDPGHEVVLRHLRALDATEPVQRLQVGGMIVFDLVHRMVASATPEKGARIEDILAILGSVGGYSCIVGVLDRLARSGAKATGNQLLVATGTDGNKYFFGDLAHQALLETHLSLLSLTLGAAQSHGGQVSLEKVHDVMRHVAETVGSADFGTTRIADPHRPGDLPFNYIKVLAPKIFDALDLYEVPTDKRASAIGFAIQRAIDGSKDVLDPTIAADIVTECAVPAAKFDPARFGGRKWLVS
jgi:hypothetical protein